MNSFHNFHFDVTTTSVLTKTGIKVRSSSLTVRHKLYFQSEFLVVLTRKLRHHLLLLANLLLVSLLKLIFSKTFSVPCHSSLPLRYDPHYSPVEIIWNLETYLIHLPVRIFLPFKIRIIHLLLQFESWRNHFRNFCFSNSAVPNLFVLTYP